MFNSKGMSRDKEKVYIVTAMAYRSKFGEEDFVENVVLGVSDSLEEALMLRDIYADVDSTFDMVTVTQSEMIGRVPDMIVMGHVAIENDPDDNPVVVARSCAVAEGTQPRLQNDETGFEALVPLNELTLFTPLAQQWCEKYNQFDPEVVILVSPSAQEML